MAEGKLYLFVAIDRTSKFAFVELHQKARKMAAAAFPRNLIAAVPCRLQIALTPLSRFAGIQLPATEPHDQGRDLETLQLRRPRPAQKSHGQLHPRIERREKVEDLQRPHALRFHLQTKDNRTGQVHVKPNRSNAGTEQLVPALER